MTASSTGSILFSGDVLKVSSAALDEFIPLCDFSLQAVLLKFKVLDGSLFGDIDDIEQFFRKARRLDAGESEVFADVIERVAAIEELEKGLKSGESAVAA